MNRMLSLGGLLAAALSLSACAGVTLPGPAPIGGSIVDQVQSYTKTACGILPAVESVAAIVATFAGGGPFVSVASEVGDAICAAVNKVSASRHGGRPTVNGVVVKYTRLRR